MLIGAGLSSSAAFETLMGTILSELFNDGKISPIEIAMIGQFAENVYFGETMWIDGSDGVFRWKFGTY